MARLSLIKLTGRPDHGGAGGDGGEHWYIFFFFGRGKKESERAPPRPDLRLFFLCAPSSVPQAGTRDGPRANARRTATHCERSQAPSHASTPCSSPREQAHGDAPRRCGPASGGWNVGVPLHLHFLMHLDQHNIKQHFSPLSVPTRACTTLTPADPPLTPLPQHAVGRKRKKAVYKEKKGKQTNKHTTDGKRSKRRNGARPRARLSISPFSPSTTPFTPFTTG